MFTSIQKSGLVEALAMINAIQLMNESPLLAAANVSLGYCVVDSCSDVSSALRATQGWAQQEEEAEEEEQKQHQGVCRQPVSAVVGAAHSEVSIAVAQQLSLQMIPQVGRGGNRK